jgi:hypothetical protein
MGAATAPELEGNGGRDTDHTLHPRHRPMGIACAPPILRTTNNELAPPSLRAKRSNPESVMTSGLFRCKVCPRARVGGGDMDDEQLGCIRNNAEWCDLVCRSHAVPGTYERSLWIQPRIGPEFYPNAITLTKGDIQEQTERIAGLSASRSGISVKDSFNALDLSALGMRRLFEAEWIWLEPGQGGLSFDRPERWSKIESAAELTLWQSAWRGASHGPTVFLPSLLDHPSVAFIAAWSGSAILAGCALNRDSNDIVGLSNFFSPAAARHAYVTAAVHHATGFAQGAPLAGYESGSDLTIMKSCGFRSVGALSIWV